MRRLVLFSALCVQSFWTQATTLPAIEISQLFRDADIVATAQVVSGETLGVGDESCGAKYSAAVIEGFKGTQAGATIEFGNYYGYQIGERYVLFLVKPGRTHEPMMSTNSMQMQGRAEYIKRCGPKLVRNTVMHSGNGAMEVRWVTDLKYKDGVAVRTRYVVLPAGVSAVSAKVTETNEFSKEVWVPLPEMTELLKGLAK